VCSTVSSDSVNRIEIEIELHRGRADALEWVSSLSEEGQREPRTRSEHDPESWWTPADHFVHTTLIERSFNEMVRRHLRGEQGMDSAMVDPSGKALRPLEDLMAYVHAYTEGWKKEQEGKPLDELVRVVRRHRRRSAVGSRRPRSHAPPLVRGGHARELISLGGPRTSRSGRCRSTRRRG
jgi:hypothetical protein